MGAFGGRRGRPALTGARGTWALLAGLCLALASSASVRAQGVEIQLDPVGCVVAQEYPKLSACFEPAGALARARVFFRPEGHDEWYYVEMADEGGCRAGVLPKPNKSLLGKRIDYYVQATDTSFDTTQTELLQALVAASSGACASEKVAQVVKTASVAVFPSMPAGFSAGGGVSTAAVVGIAAGGTAVASTVVVVAGDDEPTTSGAPAPNTPAPSPAPAPAAPTTTTTTTPPVPNRPPEGVFSIKPDPPKGSSPLEVRFNSCRSEDPDGDDLQYSFEFGDGARSSGECRLDHTYRADRTTTFQARACVSDGRAGHEVCHSYNVQVEVQVQQTDPYQPLAQLWLTMSSQLTVEGALGQVVANHEHRAFPEAGSQMVQRFSARASNLVEAQLVRGGESPGLWSFELPPGIVEPGSLRAVAGQIEGLTENTIIFRLGGEPGERVVFAFRHHR